MVLVSPMMVKLGLEEIVLLLGSNHTTPSRVELDKVGARLILHSRVYISPAVGTPVTTGETLTCWGGKAVIGRGGIRNQYSPCPLAI